MPLNSLTNIPQAVTSRAITHNFSQEEEARRSEMSLNKDFYYGKQAQSILLVNEDQEAFTLNMTKNIMKKRSSLLYSTKLIREFEGPATSIKAIESIYEDNDIDSFLLQADLMSELTGSALITPTLDEDMPNGIRLRMFDASSLSALAEEDDPLKLEALSLVKLVDRIPAGKNHEVQRILKQQIWTKESVVTYEGEVLVASETNELGFIPFCNFKGEEVYDQYLGHAPSRNIRMLNESLNRLLTDLAFSIKFQAFTPIAIEGMAGDNIMTMHPGRALSLPVGSDVKVLSTDPKIQQVLELIQWIEEKCYETSSIPKISVVGGGEATSGRELMIRWYPLLTFFNEKKVRFEKYELQLANLILNVIGLPELTSVKVNYNEEHILPLTEEEDTLESDIQMHIKTPIDELMRRNPLLTENEATAIILANKDFNDSLKGQMPGEEENMEEEDPENMDQEEEDEEEMEQEEDSQTQEVIDDE